MKNVGFLIAIVMFYVGFFNIILEEGNTKLGLWLIYAAISISGIVVIIHNNKELIRRFWRMKIEKFLLLFFCITLLTSCSSCAHIEEETLLEPQVEKQDSIKWVVRTIYNFADEDYNWHNVVHNEKEIVSLPVGFLVGDTVRCSDRGVYDDKKHKLLSFWQYVLIRRASNP